MFGNSMPQNLYCPLIRRLVTDHHRTDFFLLPRSVNQR